MSEASSLPTTKWDKLKRNWANARLGHEGMMLEKIMRQNRFVEVSARNAMTGTPGDTNGLPSMSGEGDDMGVNIGNEIHYHVTSPQTEPAAKTGETPLSLMTPSLMSKAMPYALAAALGLGGIALGMCWQQGSPPPATPGAVDNSKDYSFGFGTPKRVEWTPGK